MVVFTNFIFIKTSLIVMPESLIHVPSVSVLKRFNWFWSLCLCCTCFSVFSFQFVLVFVLGSRGAYYLQEKLVWDNCKLMVCFSKISSPTKRDDAHHLQFHTTFVDKRLETGEVVKGVEIFHVPLRPGKEGCLWRYPWIFIQSTKPSDFPPKFSGFFDKW